MNVKLRSIEIDIETAEALEARAAERGVSVAQLVAELTARDGAPLMIESDQIAELDRRWAAVETKGTKVTHEEVVGWLETWGTPAFKPWRER